MKTARGSAFDSLAIVGTPMNQRNLHPLIGAAADLEANTFQTKLAIMRAWLDSKDIPGTSGNSYE